MNAKLEGDNLVITIPFSKKGKPSKSGKTTVHASSGGNKPTTVKIGNKELVIGVNAYTNIND